MGNDTKAMSLNRRAFLAMLGATGAAAMQPTWFELPAAARQGEPDPTPLDPAFPHGIASGDPKPDGSVIWSRVDPATDGGGGVEVTWEVASDATFSDVVASGTVVATASTDHTLHVPVTGLAADGWFSYRFSYDGNTSRTGRLRTAPPLGFDAQRLRFAFCSCQQTTDSTYVAHAAMAAEDLDFVVHYGDYIYVSDGGTISISDYRDVYKRFKSNPYLQDLHAALPMVTMWDDGEFVNGVDRHMEPTRFAAARQAWFEFQPVVRPSPGVDQAYRGIDWGNLVDFALLDVRTYRDALIDANVPDGLLPTTDTALPSGAAIFDEDRSSLGAAQKAWLTSRLSASTATWKHIGTGYPFLALRLEDYDTPEARANPPAGFHENGGKYFSTEQWDGYWAERRELMDFIGDEHVENVIVTSGHTHIWFECGLRPDYDDLPDAAGFGGSPVVAREFVCGSLTADPDARRSYFPDLPLDEAEAAIDGLEAAFLAVNPHVGYIDLLRQGYGIVTFTPDQVTVDFRVIDTFDEDAVASTQQSYAIGVGELPEAVVPAPPVDPTPNPVDPPVAGPGGTSPSPAVPIPGRSTYTG